MFHLLSRGTFSKLFSLEAKNTEKIRYENRIDVDKQIRDENHDLHKRKVAEAFKIKENLIDKKMHFFNQSKDALPVRCNTIKLLKP